MISSRVTNSFSQSSLVCSNANPQDPADLMKHKMDSKQKRYSSLDPKKLVCYPCYKRIWQEQKINKFNRNRVKFRCMNANPNDPANLIKHKIMPGELRYNPLDRNKLVCVNCYRRIKKDQRAEKSGSDKVPLYCNNADPNNPKDLLKHKIDLKEKRHNPLDRN